MSSESNSLGSSTARRHALNALPCGTSTGAPAPSSTACDTMQQVVHDATGRRDRVAEQTECDLLTADRAGCHGGRSRLWETAGRLLSLPRDPRAELVAGEILAAERLDE